MKMCGAKKRSGDREAKSPKKLLCRFFCIARSKTRSKMKTTDEICYFKNLQLTCVDFAKFSTERNAEKFLEIMKEISPADAEKFFPYILFSIKLTLKKCLQEGNPNKISNITKIRLLESLKILLNNCDFSTKESNFVADLFSDLICLINLPGSDVCNDSDDLINVNLSCLITIIEKIEEHNEKIKTFVSSKEFRPVMAHLVSSCLKLLRNNNCKIMSLNCLNHVFSLSDAVSSSFLPGVSSVLLEILLNSNQNTEEEFLSFSFQILSDVIIAAGRDEKNLTEEWRMNAGLQLKTLIDRLSAVFVCHPWTNSRQNLVRFVRNIVLNDAEILKESKKRCLEVLSSLTMDETLTNKEFAQNFIDSNHYREELYSNLTAICWRLPRMSKSNHFDVQQRIEWQQFCGCMKLLGPQNLSYFFLNDVQAKLFCRSLCEAVEFNDIVWEFDARNDLSVPTESSEMSARISLRHPSDLRAQQLIFVCFDLLTEVNELETVLDHFYSIFQSKSAFKTQSSFVLNGILDCLQNKHCNYPSDLIENLLDDYINWLDIDDKQSQINVNLALNGIAVASKLIKNDIQSFLVKALYLILRLFDSPTTKQIAFSTLQNLAKSIGETSAKDLVLNNLDYLTSSIMTKMKQLSLNLDAPKVLSSILDIVNVENVDRIRFAVVECLCAVDRCRETNVVLSTLLNCLAKFGRLCQKIASPEKQMAEEIDENEDFNAERNKRKLQWHVQMIVDILNSVQCWLGAQSFLIRIASMEALRENLYALKSYDDQLLPAVHRCWPSVLARLNDVETASKLSAFGIIMTLVRTSGDFVRRRIETEASPLLEKYLTANVGDSRRAGVTYRQSPAFRLQLTMCESLGELCEKICASDEFIKKCRRLLDTYVLDDLQPQILRDAAQKSINFIKIYTESEI